MSASSWVFSCKGLAQALAAHYGGEAGFARGDNGVSGWVVFLNGERIATITDDPNDRDLWVFVNGRGIKSRDSWVIGDAVAFIDSTRAEIITRSSDLARGLAAHYGTAAVKVTRGGIGGGDVWKVEGATSDALPLAVVSFEHDPVGLFLFSGGRGMSQPIGWSLVDAVAFIDRIQNAGGVAGVMSRDGVIFRYSVEVVVTVCGGETTFTPNGAELIGLENDRTGEDIEDENYDLIVGTYGPIADARLAAEIGGLS
jgi:hypothetical protein